MLDSFRSRLVISNLLITLLGLLVVVLVFTSILVQRSTEVRKSDRAQQAQRLAHQVEALYGRHASPGDLHQLVAVASQVLGVQIIILAPDGHSVVDSKNFTPFDLGEWRLDPKALAAERSSVKTLRSSSSVYAFQSPIVGTNGRNGGAVLLIAQVKTVRPDLPSISRVLLTVLAAALLVWLVIGLYFTFSISRPLVRIRRATERMAEGDYDVRVPARGEGEIALLASRFNDMAAKVQESNRVLRDFVANVSHDLRTPLTMIAGFSQALLDGTAGPDEVAGSAGIIHDEALKMQRLVEDLLQLTRLESGLLPPERHPLELHPFVQGLLDRIARTRAGRETAALRNGVPEDTPLVEVDETQLERAVRNLVDNALQYTPAAGTVSVDASPIGRGWVEVRVSDTGAGIPPQDLARVFERFYRSDKSRERVLGNSGLGLAIVQEIIEGHGGQVRVESELGKGTTFFFTLPQARAAIRRPASEQADPAMAQSTPR